MLTLIIIQLILAVLLIIFVLLQGSDNEGLGLGGGGGMGGMMSPRGSANLLSRLNRFNSDFIHGDECCVNNFCISRL